MLSQFDFPAAVLQYSGQITSAAVYSILVNDMLRNTPYRTNDDIGRAVGIGRSRIKQILQQLTRYGLLEEHEHKGRRRTLAISPIPNQLLLEDFAKFMQVYPEDFVDRDAEMQAKLPFSYEIPNGACAEEIDQQKFTDEGNRALNYPLFNEVKEVVASLLANKETIALFQWEPIPDLLSQGYVKTYESGTELASFTNTNTAYFLFFETRAAVEEELPSVSIIKERVIKIHATSLGSTGLSSRAMRSTRKSPKISKATAAQSGPVKSFTYRFKKADELKLDTEYYTAVEEILNVWNKEMGASIPLIGEIYRQIRECLCEHGVAPSDLERAVRNFASDPFWRSKSPGIAIFFGNASRVFEYRDKGMVHDRFARNIAEQQHDLPDVIEF